MKSDNISPIEWRWVAIVSGILVTLTLLPYAWALAASNDQYAFMGILFNPLDGATYLSKIEQGREGNWLFEMRHTPQEHDPAGFHLFYLTLGHLARFFGLSNVVIFHLARVATSFFMFSSLYQLGAAIWIRERPRRLFFFFVSFGSGMGWFVLLFSPESLAPDMNVPEAFPLLAAFTNPHFPLAIGCMALIAEHLITVFRPGYADAPTLENGGLLLIFLTVILTIVSPAGAMIIGGTLVFYTVARALHFRKGFRFHWAERGLLAVGMLAAVILGSTDNKWLAWVILGIMALYALSRSAHFTRLPIHEARWSAMVLLPAFPFALYYIAVFRFNPVMEAFNRQNQTPSPNLLLFAFGYGLLFFIAIPGLWRAFRRFEPDGDQLMLCWVISNLVGVYAPGFDLQRRLFIGLIIPTVYFAVRSLEDYWIERVPEKWRMPALITVFVFVLPTHAFTFGAPLAMSVAVRQGGAENYLLLEGDYIKAFDWLNENAKTEQVALAAPQTSLWIPTKTSLRVVYGHPFETVPAQERLNQVEAFYRGQDCKALFDPDLPFVVSYVLWGPQENRLDETTDEDKAESDNPGLEDLSPETAGDTQRPSEADQCRLAISEQAAEQREFGNVTLYILAAR